MTTVSAGTASTYTFSQGESVTVSPDAGEAAQVIVTCAGVQKAGTVITATRTLGPFNAGDLLSVTALRGDVDYTVQIPVVGSALTADGSGNVIGTDRLPAITPFVSAVKGALASYGLAYSASTGAALTNAQPPWLWQDSQGHTQFPHNSTIKGMGFCLGNVVYQIATGSGGTHCYTYDKTARTWAKKTASAINATASILPHLFFGTSAGVLFVAWAPSGAHAGGQTLFRSADGGTTWTTVLSSSDMPLVDDYVGTMCEDDRGNLYCSSYNSVVTPATKQVWKSTDGGLTWTSIYAAIALANDYARHVHSVAWDKYRRALWVSGGDGANTKIVVSTDYGATFTAWAGSWQATAFAFSPTAVVFCSDIAKADGTQGYHGLYRTAGTTVAQILASKPTVTFKHGTAYSPVSPISGLNGVEFAWRGLYNAQGIFIFPYGRAGTGAALMVSSDDGATWTDALGGTASASSAFVTGSGTQWAFEPVSVSDYAHSDGWLYCLPNSGSYSTRRWRVYPYGAQLSVNGATGDDVSGDGITTPFATPLDYGIVPPAQYVLTGDVTVPVVLTRPGVIVNRGNFMLGAADAGTGTVIASETFEGTSSLTTLTSGSGPGTVDQASTTNPYIDPFAVGAGTKAARCTLVAAADVAMVRKVNGLTSVVAGNTVWAYARMYLTAASITTAPVLMQLQNGVNIQTQTTANGGALIATTAVDSKQYTQSPADIVAVPLGSWFGVLVAADMSTTQGRIRVWQITGDGPGAVHRLVIDVKGVNTFASGLADLRIGMNGGQAGLINDIDAVQCVLGFDPTLPGAYALRGQGQLVLPDMVRS